MKNSNWPISPFSLAFDHFYVGVLITLFYIWISPHIIDAGFPGMSVLLAAEILILAPLVLLHLMISARKNSVKLTGVIPFRQKISSKSFIKWTLIGLLGCILVYTPLYPVGIFLRQNLFAWLPEWYFNPAYGTDNLQLIANTFLAGILIDGLIGPIAEEFYFRGYLLPRMEFLKNWAPIVNGAMFGLYHFWQPHNFLATMAVGIVLSWVTWKTKNVYVPIVIHCTLNILGSVGGFLAATNGVVIGR